MTKIEEKNEKVKLVKELLKTYTCLTSRQISIMANIRKQTKISPSSAAGVLRSLASVAEVSCSKNERGENVYWLVN